MATYGYKAITKAGKEVKGSLEADNKDLAMAELRRQELTVIDLGEQSFLTKDIDIQIGGWPKARDLSVMCRQFVSMTKAGVSILESLKMLCEQKRHCSAHRCGGAAAPRKTPPTDSCRSACSRSSRPGTCRRSGR